MTEDWILGREIEVLLLALVLSAARSLAFVMVLPLFTRFGLQQGLIRGGILVAFAAPVFPGLVDALTGAPSPSGFLLVGLLCKELFIGILLALVVGLPLWAVAAAGDIIDFQRGASMATLVDPGSGDETTPTGTLFFLLTAFVLVASGWFTEVVMTSLYETYLVWPVLDLVPLLDPRAAGGVLAILDGLMETGLVLSVPILGPLLLAEVAMGLAGRYTQQINVMLLAMSGKQVLFVLLLPIYFGALMYYMQGEIRDIGGSGDVLRGFLNPGEIPGGVLQ